MKYCILIFLSLLIPGIVNAGLKPNYKHKKTLNIIQEIATQEHVPFKLLAGICWIESHYRHKAINQEDGGSPSYGMCQIKVDVARDYGFHGKPEDLLSMRVNLRYAAKHLRFELDRYDEIWNHAIAAYNGGKLRVNKQGVIRNVKYVKKVLQIIKVL